MNITAIDTHTHINTNSKYDTEISDVYKADLDSIIKLSDKANIGQMFISTFSSVLSDEEIERENEYLFRLACENDRIFQWVVIDPRNRATLEQAEKMLANKKCVGIKIHPDYHNYSVGEYGDLIFSFASERNATVLMHPQIPLETAIGYADKYKNINLIIAHVGISHIDPIKKAKYHNVYTDTSGSASLSNFVIEHAVKQLGSEKILFGTDTYSTGAQRGRIEYAMISDKDKENILKNNAERLFAKNLF